MLACLDAGLDTRRRDVLDGKEVESNVTGTRVALDYGVVGAIGFASAVTQGSILAEP